jgi:hypothetical protein
MDIILTEIHNKIFPMYDLLSTIYGHLDAHVQPSLIKMVIKQVFSRD